MRGLLISIALVAACSVAAGITQDEKYSFSDYADMRAHFGGLYEAGKYAAGAELLEWALDRYPEHLMANSYNLALTYCQLEKYEEAIDTLRYALDRGIWFYRYAFANEAWDALKQLEGFGEIEVGNEALRQKAQENAKPGLVVATPEGYDKEKAYPLFIALHGGNSNISEFKPQWTSERMRKEFIVAYLQSSQVASMSGFDWTQDLEITKREIADAYRDVIGEYWVAEDEVIVGGFSSGGVAALEVALCSTIPMSGFIVLCPGRPESFQEESAAAAKNRGLRGSILTTEMDPRLPAQKEMVEILEKTGLRHRFVVTPNVGHWIPDDLGTLIDSSIHHIRSK